MKLIDNGGQQAGWQNAILADLSFIKKHLRFPVSAKTLAPTLIITTGLFIGLQLVLGVMQIKGNKVLSVFMLLLVAIAIFSSILKFIRALRFQRIPSPYFLNENIKALEYFLKAQQLAFSQLADAPEVFCIISRSISTSGDKREVMFFIADDKRILVNSHFTGQKFVLNPPSGQSRQMAQRLDKWLRSFVERDGNMAITPLNAL